MCLNSYLNTAQYNIYVFVVLFLRDVSSSHMVSFHELTSTPVFREKSKKQKADVRRGFFSHVNQLKNCHIFLLTFCSDLDEK